MRTSFPQLLVITLISAIAFSISSCCSDDKVCPAGAPSMGQLPYALNERLVFKDSLGNTIQIQLSNTYTTSPSYSVNGQCSTPRKEQACTASAGIDAVSIIDSNHVIPANLKVFSVSLERQDLTNQPLTHYALSAFGSAFVFGNYQNGDLSFPDAIPVSAYPTPFGTYPLVYACMQRNASGLHKTVVLASGKLVSFTLGGDTLHTFYLVK